ncbi:MAG: integrase, partial [Dehalococcoidia bacterium]
MPDDEKMSIDERRKYLKLVAPRYAKVGRKGRGELLTEMVEVTELHRKSLIRLMSMPSLERARRKTRLRRRRYGSAVADVIRVVWETLDYVCAERLTPVLQDTA